MRLPLRAAALSLVLLSLPLLAGCVGTAAASAIDARSSADQAALAWDPGAKLAHVMGIEGTFPAMLLQAVGASGSERSGDFAEADEDERVGDGLASAWLYRYVAAGKDTAYVVVVDAKGDVVREEESAHRSDDVPLSLWTLDSDAAMEKALAANADLKKGLERERFGYVAILRQESGDAHARWLIAGGGGDSLGLGGGFAIVDAVTGAVMTSEGGAFDA